MRVFQETDLGRRLVQERLVDTEIGGRPASLSLSLRNRGRARHVGRVTVWDGNEIAHNVVQHSVTPEAAVRKIGREVRVQARGRI